jgi:hypothetical protein
MRNSNQQPPKYGAEGPPGGAEAWNRQRFGGGQQQSGMARMLSTLASANPQMRAAMEAKRAQQQSMSQPRPWDQVQRAVWPGQGQPQPPQGMAPSPQGQPPQAQMPGAPPMSGEMPQQSQASQAAGQPQLPQQTGMAGLGQAAGRGMQMMRAAALRRGGGRGMPGNMQEQ